MLVLPRYKKALTRDDLSQWLIHLTHGTFDGGLWMDSKAVLMNILAEGRVRASKREEITKYEPEGAACFYEVPPKSWDSLVHTNPSGRQGYGLIVAKPVLWAVGGRPAIYDSEPGHPGWPLGQRFRLIWTDLTRNPDPVDWTHEREWRVRGDLRLNAVDPARLGGPWWWPCVERDVDTADIFSRFPPVSWIYSLERKDIIDR